MRYRAYWKEKFSFIAANLVLLLATEVYMYLYGTPFIYKAGAVIIWVLPMMSFFTVDFNKKRKFANKINITLDQIDKKYLLSEVIDKPGFSEGEFLLDTIKSMVADMCSSVNTHEAKRSEYQEYIEIWLHEIKTPIASINLILDNHPTEITGALKQNISQIENYLEQILFYARSDSVEKDYCIKQIDLSTLVKNTIKKMSRDFIGRNIRLELDELDGTVYVDEKWAEFVLGQILSNSIKYSKKSSAEIKMFGKRLEKCMMLTIQDNGVGIVPEDVDRVFEKGFTGINGRRFGSSTGMGLYICKKLCDTLGMKIYLSSKVDVGTEVRIIFPISQYTLLEP